MVDVAAKMARCGMSEGPAQRALIHAGRANPDEAVLVAERLAGIGDAEHVAFLIGGGGAYGGQAPFFW